MDDEAELLFAARWLKEFNNHKKEYPIGKYELEAIQQVAETVYDKKLKKDRIVTITTSMAVCGMLISLFKLFTTTP